MVERLTGGLYEPGDPPGQEPDGMHDVRAALDAARLASPAPGSAHDGTGPLDLPCSRFARNDMGNAQRFRARQGEDFRFLEEGGWMAWDGHRWDRRTGKNEARLAAQAVVAAIRNEARALEAQSIDWEAAAQEPGESDEKYLKRLAREHADRVDALMRHANSSGNTGKINGLLTEAEPHLHVARERVDAHIWLFNAHDVTLELAEPGLGKIDAVAWPWRARPSQREDLGTRRAGAAYPAAIFADSYDGASAEAAVRAAAPAFHAFLERVQPDPAMRAYLRRIAGYLLTGATSAQELFLNLGRGANGKGTFYEALAHALGDYAAVLPIEAIRHNENRSGSQARPELARLPGARFVRISESDENERLSEGTVKKLTGQDTVEVRDLFKGIFEFAPQFKLVIYLNQKPKIMGTDDGIWRRIRLIEWPVQIPEAEKDPELPEKLRREADGILAWALLGFAEWREIRLAAPASVRDATEGFRIERDPLIRFVEDCLVADPGKTMAASTLYALYKLWCESEELEPLTPTSFGLRLPGRTIGEGPHAATIEKSKKGTVRYANVAERPSIQAVLASAIAVLKRAPRASGGGGAPAPEGDPGPASPDDYGVPS
jgi:putative DNA primase/helicase